jgi:hypothetical protein
MTDSALIVFLPLVGAVVGAIVGAWANSWYRDREAKKAEDRDRYGLLLLMHAELHHNEFLLLSLKGDPSEPELDTFSNFQTNTWISSRVRLAQLLSKDHITALATYYSWLETFSDVLNDKRMPFDEKIDEVKGFVSGTLYFSDAAKRFGAKYIFDDLGFDPVIHIPISHPDLEAAIRGFEARHPNVADTRETGTM